MNTEKLTVLLERAKDIDILPVCQDESSLAEQLMQTLTELSKAVECHRKQRHANIELFMQKIKLGYDKAYRDYIGYTVEDSLAGIVIVCLAINNNFEVDIASGYKIRKNMQLAYPSADKSFADNAWQFSKAIIGGPTIKAAMFIKLLNIIHFVELWSKQLDIDIWRHVEIKLNYIARKP